MELIPFTHLNLEEPKFLRKDFPQDFNLCRICRHSTDSVFEIKWECLFHNIIQWYHCSVQVILDSRLSYCLMVLALCIYEKSLKKIQLKST